MTSGTLPYASLRYYLADKLRRRRARRRARSRAYVIFGREEWESWAGGLYKGPPPPKTFRDPRRWSR